MGLISGGLFLSIGVLYERLHTRAFKDFGGIAKKMPRFAICLSTLQWGRLAYLPQVDLSVNL